MLDAGFAGLGEDVLPVDGAAADVGHVTGDRMAHGADVAVGVGAFLGPILDVDQREAARVFIEVGDGILSARR